MKTFLLKLEIFFLASLRVIFKLIVVIPFSFLAFVACIRLWILTTYDFIIYGGEAVAYNDKYNRTTILEVYKKLDEKLKDPTIIIANVIQGEPTK